MASIVAFLLLAACSKSAEQKGDGWIEIHDEGGSGSVKEIVLPSGVHCAVLIGIFKGAISCDWPR